jgi:hypothetical protein
MLSSPRAGHSGSEPKGIGGREGVVNQPMCEPKYAINVQSTLCRCGGLASLYST